MIVRFTTTYTTNALFCCLDVALHHSQQYYSYIVEVSFIEGNRKTQRKSTDLSQITDKFALIELRYENMDFVIHTDPIVLHPELSFGERVCYCKLYSI
jgi:hypothetical protein